MYPVGPQAESTRVEPASKLTITEKTLQKLFPVFQNIVDKQKQDRLALASEELNKLFPNKIKKNKRKYVKNSVHVALESWSQLIDDFSEKDCDSIRELFDRLLLKDGFIKPEVLLKTKQKLDQQYIEDVIEGYKKLLKQKKETGNLEKRWQVFLGEHNWVFSYLFTFPVILAEQEAYVGGKNLSNQNGKVTDFLIQNSITDNVAFLEIKTHRTKLLGPLKAYRGNDVFSMSSDLSGGISQVLDQRDNFQKAYALLRVNSNESFDTINSKCVVLMGMLGDLNSKQTKSFELFRSNSKDVEIVCFDELLLRFEKLQELIRR